MSVLKKVTTSEITQAKEEAKALYLNRLEGNDVDITAEADARGNFPRRWFRGAISDFTVTGIDALLPLVAEKLAQGFKLSGVPTYVLGPVHTVHMIKPDAAIALDLKDEYADAEAALKARVEAQNAVIVEKEVQAMIQRELSIKAKQVIQEEQDMATRIRAEVLAALGVK